MSITLNTYTGSSLTATEHAMMNAAAYPHDCILTPSELIGNAGYVTVNERSIVFDGKFYGMIAGRLFCIEDETFTLTVPNDFTNGYGQLLAKVDLANVDTPFSVYFNFAATEAGLIQETVFRHELVNFTTTIIYVPLAKFTITAKNITDFEWALPVGVNAWGLINRKNASPAGTIPVVLFEGDTQGDVALSGITRTDSFEILEIFFDGYNHNNPNSIRILNPTDQVITLSIIESGGTANDTRIRRAKYTIDGNTLVNDASQSGYIMLTASGITPAMGSNVINVRKVLGWYR